ncbi:dephospho-CoA kinase [Corynebacterium sp. H113]|uniref:dephospho-CoA kinase n=1 Tax=Corynebacterium sp. H113 TaxID=3133419 RepID=UPI0030B2EA56
MLKVGLTGGIGSGKSTVARQLSALGAVIIDADQIAREIVEPGQPALAELVDYFGSDILNPDDTLNRRELARRAFASEESTQILNSITHPRISERTAELYDEASARDVVVFDMPLLIENDLVADQHLVIVVNTPMEKRIDRLVNSRGLDRDDVERRIAAQIGDEERIAAADIILDNSGSEDALRDSVDKLWRERLQPIAQSMVRPPVVPLDILPVQPRGRVEREKKRVERQLGVSVKGTMLSENRLILMVDGVPNTEGAPWMATGQNWISLDPGNPVTLTPPKEMLEIDRQPLDGLDKGASKTP